MSAILEVKNLNLGFNLSEGFSQAIYDVSFSLNIGETLAIVGESGCGKTISTMSVLQLLPQTAQIKSGEIIYNGENLLSFNQKQMQKIRGKKIALIPQDPMPSLNPLYTIGNQMLEIIELHQNVKGKEAFNIAVEALERVKIPDAKAKMKSYPHEFSGGMKQRVSIVRALSYDAPLLLMDEPFGALDALTRDHLNEELLKIWQKTKKTVIFVTHSIEEASFLSDRVLVMSARPGRVKEMVEIDLPRPRGEATRNDPKFTEYNKYLRGIIG